MSSFKDAIKTPNCTKNENHLSKENEDDNDLVKMCMAIIAAMHVAACIDHSIIERLYHSIYCYHSRKRYHIPFLPQCIIHYTAVLKIGTTAAFLICKHLLYSGWFNNVSLLTHTRIF